VTGFDAERYLRLVGERWVPDGKDGPPWNPVLAAAGAGLVAVGALTNSAAQAVIDEYYQASASAEGRRYLMSRRAARPVAAAPPDIGQLRVVPCERVIDQRWGRLTIHYVAFTDHATTLRVTLQPDQSHGRPCGLPPAEAEQPRVTDDHGTAATAEFSGESRHGDPAWSGQYQVRPLLAADAAWIELFGKRVELTGTPAGIVVWGEPMPAQDPAVRHLWERTATLNDFHDPHLALNATIAALVAAGALHADDPVIADAQAVLAVLRPPSASSAERSGDLPEPWRSLLARWGRAGGAVGMVTVGAVTPLFDGVTAAVVALESHDEHFGIKVELVPGVRTGLPYGDLPDQQHLTWWAADDLGNHYLGEQGSWGTGDDRCGGAIGFWPALDPRARRIDLMPTATTARAVIRVPLPWAEHKQQDRISAS
jgi:hypothetical protein